jgi:hypothetical protein
MLCPCFSLLVISLVLNATALASSRQSGSSREEPYLLWSLAASCSIASPRCSGSWSGCIATPSHGLPWSPAQHQLLATGDPNQSLFEPTGISISRRSLNRPLSPAASTAYAQTLGHLSYQARVEQAERPWHDAGMLCGVFGKMGNTSRRFALT